MYYLIGLFISGICFVSAIFNLKQDFVNYFDLSGLFIVVGGTCALGVMTFPWQHRAEIVRSLKELFYPRKLNLLQVNTECFALVKDARDGVTDRAAGTDLGYYQQVLADGRELLQLGFRSEKIEKILDERIYQWNDRNLKVAHAFRSLAKYPPAFGLMGTVFGLVSLMRSISSGAGSTEIGYRMAVALVSTLYGLILANLILNPAGERIQTILADEKKAAELCLRAVVIASETVSLLEAQEILNSYVKPAERVTSLNQFSEEENAA
jgi:chemotaxis protein MotA